MAAVDMGAEERVPQMLGEEPIHRELSIEDGKEEAKLLSVKRLLDLDGALANAGNGGAGPSYQEYVTRFFGKILAHNGYSLPGQVLNLVGAIPPCFSQRQRSVLRGAMEKAGFERVRLVDDTLAALLASRDRLGCHSEVLVYSWGATTFTAAVYRLVGATFRAVAQEGDRDLGGDDLDALVLTLLLPALGSGWTPPAGDCSGILDSLEAAKRALIDGKEYAIPTTPFLNQLERGSPVPARISLDSASLKKSFLLMVKRTIDLAEKAVAEGKVEPSAILLTGGLAVSAAVANLVACRFKGEIIAAEPDAVAKGAALWGAQIPAEDWEASGKRVQQEKRLARAATGPATPAQNLVALSPPAEPSGVQAGNAPGKSPGEWAALFLPFFNEAERLGKEDRLEEAAAKIEELNERLGKFFALVLRNAAETQQARGQSDRAFALLAKANRLDPAHVPSALALVSRHSETAAGHGRRSQWEQAHYFTGEALRIVRAIPDAEKSHAHILAPCLRNHAEACIRLSQWNEAEKALERFLRLSPDSDAAGDLLERVRAQKSRIASVARASYGPLSGKNRNLPCPCGSKRKYKSCCGPKWSAR
jgi:tetratricopeptide (TPR) repeat protein